MRILNYREGFANNSSSTHSTIINDKKQPVEEALPMFLNRTKHNELILRLADTKAFGWSPFILSKKDAIDYYLAAQIFSNLQNLNNPDYSTDKAIEFVHSLLPNIETDQELEIDHQSVWTLPVQLHDQAQLDKEFIQDLINYYHEEPVVVLGGNDNSYPIDYGEHFDTLKSFSSTPIKRIPLERQPKDYVAKKDNNVWTIFSKKDGQKFRLSFTDNNIESSQVPELVDLIITDQCTQGCEFCYRGCTSDGNYAPIEKVKEYITALSKIGVMEIVLGGGDILSYPDLSELCEFIQQQESVVFTTTVHMNTRELKTEKRKALDLLAETCKSIAVSITQMEQSSVITYLKLTSSVSCSLQIIPEIIRQSYLENFAEFSRTNYLPVTLLGFKPTGRGRSLTNNLIRIQQENQAKMKEIVEMFSDSRRISVDTQFLLNFPGLTANWDSRCWDNREGKFSCCVDVVKQKIAQSSYCTFSYILNKEKPLETVILEQWNKIRC